MTFPASRKAEILQILADLKAGGAGHCEESRQAVEIVNRIEFRMLIALRGQREPPLDGADPV